MPCRSAERDVERCIDENPRDTAHGKHRHDRAILAAGERAVGSGLINMPKEGTRRRAHGASPPVRASTVKYALGGLRRSGGNSRGLLLAKPSAAGSFSTSVHDIRSGKTRIDEPQQRAA